MKYFALPLMMSALALPAAAHAEMSAEQKADIENIVREYILENGQVLIEGVNNFQKKQEQEANKSAEGEAKKLLDSIKKDKNLAMAGNPDGDVIVVEFFDFHCGYCKKAFSEVQSLLKDDKNVKVIFYDMPILGPSSVEMSRWALASKKQGKYFEYHKALMTHTGDVSENTLRQLADEVGLDVEKLAKDKAAPEIEAEIQTHLQMAQKLGIQGTPGFLINEKIFRGYIPYEAITQTIKDARSAAK